MNQQEQTQSTTVNRRSRNRRKSGLKSSFLSAKKSNIPLPTESSDKKNDIIKWGKKNEFPYYLNYLFKNNPIHAGIVRAKRYFTVAGGLVYNGSNQTAFDEFFKNKKRNHKDKNLNQLVSDISLDYEKSNFAFFKVKFSFVGERKYRKLERIPFETVRFEEISDEEGKRFQTGNIRVSDNWLESNPNYEIIKPYSPNNQEQYECFVMIREESGQSIDNPDAREVNPGIYPDPPYGGAIRDIDTGIQVSVHNNSEIHNNFALGNILNLNNGAPKNPDDKKRLESEVKEASTGSLQAGGTLILYNNGKDTAADVVSLNGNNLPDRYNNTKSGAEDSIIYGHQVVVPTLFGMKQEGSFNASELETGYAIMQANYFSSRRTEILEALNWIMNEIAGIEGEITFDEVNINFEQQVEADENAKTANALNKMSPLVATKVLSSMTPNEIRSLAKLLPINGGDELPKSQVFTEEEGDVILERLKMLGTSRDEFNVVYSTSLSNGELTKDELVSDFKSKFADLTDLQVQTLNLINEDEDFNSIRKALDISGVELTKIYQKLLDLELINNDGKLTSEGEKQVAVSEVESIVVMYEYALRPDAPALVTGGSSRPFCTELLRLNRLYTRDEINTISGVEGYDVFAYRGGWYHNPNTGKNEPGCRHEWRQVITFNK